MRFKAKILLIYTGGTIGMSKDLETGALKAFDFSRLWQQIPELEQLDCEIESVSFEKPIDSSNMNPEIWGTIAKMIASNYGQFDGFVVLHGTDTMSYTASALSFMLENLAKPVILTGSQLPIGDLRTDAKENLITAIQIASHHDKGQAVFQEVGLYFEYKLYRGNRTTKVNAEHFKAFNSPNYPCLVESGVHLKWNSHLLLPHTDIQNLKVHYQLDAQVLILKLFPGICGTVLQAILGIPTLKGIVLETYGTGNAPTSHSFVESLQQAIHKGLYVINVTQCSSGSVDMGHYETSRELKELGVISGKDITTEAAITKLMYLLGKNTPKNDFKLAFETSLRGEMN
ncbi:asparaginase [Flavobacterium sp. UMI-01]|uniref:asparaginase n=1 Tax=Flavobacterium sp. UMI-01 TaxID=1441053 RepID=UPI001C7D133E|nr:asparaginase [Flavobacterium sp. UMI-01]GIZ09356.1 L-asparaginase 1 [Flavobacterium sp. UMI-01]